MSTHKSATHEGQSSDITDDIIPHNSTTSGGSSDGEGGERTAREKLKKTSIAGLAQFTNNGANTSEDQTLDDSINIESSSNQPGDPSARGRPSKKRSFEDLQKDDPNTGIENGNIGPPLPKSGHHKRMRSRDVSNVDEVQTYNKLDEVASPVREESDFEAQESPGGPGVLVEPPVREHYNQQMEEQSSVGNGFNDTTAKDASGKSKPVIQNSVEAETSADTSLAPGEHNKSVSSTSTGFANASTTSPFGNFKPSTSPEPASKLSEQANTSKSAFASSGLSAFASSEKSPFGAAGATAQSSGGFGGGNSSSGFGGGGSLGVFGSVTGKLGGSSLFAAQSSSGFGKTGGFGSSTGGFGSGFGSRPFGGGLSSFAGPPGPSGSFAKAKPLGEVRDDEHEGSDRDEEGEDGEQQFEETRRDNRFVEQDVETGEEAEKTIFSCRAKLYHFEKEWKERGVGTFKINIRYERQPLESSRNKSSTENEGKGQEDDLEAGSTDEFTTTERKARLIMRTDGVHRVILNTPVFKDMNVGTHDGKEPNGKTMHLAGLENGKPVGFQIKIGKEEVLKDLYHKIQDLKQDLM